MNIAKSTLTYSCVFVCFCSVSSVLFQSCLPVYVVHALLEMSSAGCYINGWDRVSFLSKFQEWKLDSKVGPTSLGAYIVCSLGLNIGESKAW